MDWILISNELIRVLEVRFFLGLVMLMFDWDSYWFSYFFDHCGPLLVKRGLIFAGGPAIGFLVGFMGFLLYIRMVFRRYFFCECLMS